ncbi:farnesyl pyrophosphate synthetase 1 [Penicillium taxi]|uniref:farnesyl pyrophosphate synthetase 1 n=1 Tax=Penicillium taxi TaxID=168475 RepID=UPI002544DE5F|nr:farnesyl pyrophosphate synthetase 1 [Penicillium taxi]KAJ5888345.1 farnesyl pyrophosphate synthetase 1 [Penicillium taxi]
MDPLSHEKFISIFDDLVQELKNHLSRGGFSAEAIQQFSHCLNTNTTSGKLHRGLTVLVTANNILNRPLSDEEFRQLSILGWLIELFQAAYLIWDDIMDNSTTRRGQPCWYRQPGVGLMAVNDACLLKSAIFLLLESHFTDHPAYTSFVNLFLKASLETELGQFSDMFASHQELGSFTMDKYRFIVDRKSSYYSLYMPVALVLVYLRLSSPSNLGQARKLATALGEYFQIEDDYLDVFGDPHITKKIGTDIQDNKCTWVINEAIIRCSDKQLCELQKTYGRNDTKLVSRAKDVFKELGIETIYEHLEETQTANIEEMIANIDESEGLKQDVFTQLFAQFRRGRGVKAP